MIRHLIIIPIILLAKLTCSAQCDTLYILYQPSDTFEKAESNFYKKNEDRPEVFPFLSNNTYYVKDDTGRYKDYFFSYTNLTLEGSEKRFDFREVSKAYFEGKSLIDQAWLTQQTTKSLRKYFDPDSCESSPVIMLAEEEEMKKDSFYIVRVYFLFMPRE